MGTCDCPNVYEFSLAEDETETHCGITVSVVSVGVSYVDARIIAPWEEEGSFEHFNVGTSFDIPDSDEYERAYVECFKIQNYYAYFRVCYVKKATCSQQFYLEDIDTGEYITGATVKVGGAECEHEYPSIERYQKDDLVEGSWYDVVASKSGYTCPDDICKDTFEACGSAITLKLKTEPTPEGYITVTSNPSGAGILINGNITGDLTPHTYTVDIGTYNVDVFHSEYYSPGSQTVEVTASETVPVHFDLIPIDQKGTLRVTSNPSGAGILINNNLQPDLTPHDFLLDYDTYTVSVFKPGYICTNCPQDAIVEAGATTTVSFTLESEPLPEAKGEIYLYSPTVNREVAVGDTVELSVNIKNIGGSRAYFNAQVVGTDDVGTICSSSDWLDPEDTLGCTGSFPMPDATVNLNFQALRQVDDNWLVDDDETTTLTPVAPPPPPEATNYLKISMKPLFWANRSKLEGLISTIAENTAFLIEPLGYLYIETKLEENNIYIYYKKTGTPAVPLLAILAAVATIILGCGFIIIGIGWYKSLTNEELEITSNIDLRNEQLKSCKELYEIGTEEYHNCISDIKLAFPDDEESLWETIADFLNMTVPQVKVIATAGGGLLALSFIMPLFRR